MKQTVRRQTCVDRCHLVERQYQGAVQKGEDMQTQDERYHQSPRNRHQTRPDIKPDGSHTTPRATLVCLYTTLQDCSYPVIHTHSGNSEQRLIFNYDPTYGFTPFGYSSAPSPGVNGNQHVGR